MPTHIEDQFIAMVNQSLEAVPPITDIDDALERAARVFRILENETLVYYREILRTKILADNLVGDAEKTEFTADFDGYGDSGSVYANTGSILVDAFLERMVDLHVKFDWYNNDGGGGDITWNVTTDKVIINGYQNVTEIHSMMEEEEF